ncbi:hypothetical protein [Burkholderia sp. LMU1-1-1.1]
MFKGPLAKDLFDQIGPGAKMPCGGAKDHGYAYYFGLDVPTGKSTPGAIC